MRGRDEWLQAARQWVVRREPWLVLLILAAVLYYGSYYRHSINFRDEGGTVALLSKRLLEGERPFLDVVLGYNVLWFYPVVGLYKLFGVSFVLLRVYCFALSTLTAVLGFLAVERVSRRPWVAFLTGLILVLVPGMTFKNYMPLLAVANSFCLLCFVNPRPARREHPAADAAWEAERSPVTAWRRLLTGSIVLGLTFLIRIDVGIFFSLLWLGALFLQIGDRSRPWRARVALALLGPIIAGGTVWLVHLPVYMDAKRRGFDAQFVQQYLAWPKSIQHALQERFGKAKPPAPAVAAAPVASADGTPAAKTGGSAAKAHSWNREILKRRSFLDTFRSADPEERLLAILLYAPLLTLLPLVLWAVIRVIRALRSEETGALRRPLAALLMLGGALTVFPQYFFFRPDSPHLSEFSPGFWVATVSACFLLGKDPGPRSKWSSPLATALLTVLALHAGVFLWRMLPDRWTGTIAARKNRTQFFKAENGVNVYVSKREYQGLNALKNLIQTHSQPSDYLVAYPYHPSINLLADRRTYEKNVYIDNATRSRNWDAEAIARFQRFRPAIIVLSDWDINGTEASRFSVWAEKTKTWIQTNYVYQGTYLEFEVYTRPAGGATGIAN